MVGSIPIKMWEKKSWDTQRFIYVGLLLVLQLQTIKMNKHMVILFYLLFDDLLLELN